MAARWPCGERETAPSQARIATGIAVGQSTASDICPLPAQKYSARLFRANEPESRSVGVLHVPRDDGLSAATTCMAPSESDIGRLAAYWIASVPATATFTNRVSSAQLGGLRRSS